MTTRVNFRPALAGILLAGLMAACSSSPATTSSPSASGSSQAPTPSAVASPGESVTASAGAIPSFDLSSLTGVIPGVDSYRTSFSTGGVVSYSTVVVTKPTLSKAITSFKKDGTVDTRFIVIGDKAWMAEGADGAFQPLPSSTSAAMLAAFDPALLLGAYANVDWTAGGVGANKGVETKNGVQATHLKIDASTFAFLATGWPAGASIDIWVADAGYLVAWEMTGFEADQDVMIEVTGINDPANQVQAPN